MTGVLMLSEHALRVPTGRCSHAGRWSEPAGVTANPLLGMLGLDTARAGRLVVTPELHAPQRSDVFAAGDAAAAKTVAAGLPPT